MKYRILVAAILLSTFAVAQAQTNSRLWKDESPEWRRGWCDAVKAVIQNRNHYRAMLHYPAETVEESMKRIYEKWPPRMPDGYSETNSIVSMSVNLEMAGIDLYVILPPQVCEGQQ